MFLNSWTSASGHYGMTTTVTTEYGFGVDKENDVVFAYTPDKLLMSIANYKVALSDSFVGGEYAIKIPNGDTVAFFTFEMISGIEFALCSYSNDPGDGNGWRNEFVYIVASAIDYNKISDKFPQEKRTITFDVPYIPEDETADEITYKINKKYLTSPLGVNEFSTREHEGEAWICISDDITWVLNPLQLLLNSCYQIRDPQNAVVLGNSSFYTEAISKYTIVSAVLSSSGGSPVVETIGPGNIEYLLITYDGYARYVKKSNFQRYDGKTPILKIFEEQGDKIDSNVKISTNTVTTKKETCMLNSDQVLKWKGSHQANVDADNYCGLLSAGTSIGVCAYEIINNAKFLIRVCGGFRNYYIPINAIETMSEEESNKLHANENSGSSGGEDLADRDTEVTKPYDEMSSVYWDSDWNPSTVGKKNPLDDYGINNDFNISETEESIESNGSADKSKHGDQWNNNRWYEITLPVGIYPDDAMNELTGAADLEIVDDRRLPSDWYDFDTPNDSIYYSLQHYNPEYLSKEEGWAADKRQISKINRFKYITDKSGLSTKSFIFMTKPDLNLYKLDENDVVIWGTMNPDLIRLPEFKYIGRNKDVGFDILDSLEYFGTGSGYTPWLSIITNQAEGYTPIDREIGYTEVGETFHGHKVLYGKHDFKHNVAGTVTIPFSERRDLSLYYTLKIWTEYIHCINIGLVEPHPIHMLNKELDYAVSLYYIQTDETMENIIYWEKLTGVFPLKCPDSFFAWNKGEPGKNMEYDIEFAYSMRSVLRTPDLLELDRLYMKGCSNDAETTYYKAPDGTYTDKTMDLISNRYIAKMAAYFNIERYENLVDKFGQTIYRPAYPSGKDATDKWVTKHADVHTDEYQKFVDKLLSNPNDLSKYFYEPYYPEPGKVSVTEFLSNYSIYLQSPGIPYVTGPFVVPHPEYNGGKFLLKWV